MARISGHLNDYSHNYAHSYSVILHFIRSTSIFIYKHVIPVHAGIQLAASKILDPGIRRDDVLLAR